jgi:hypothetical protein
MLDNKPNTIPKIRVKYLGNIINEYLAQKDADQLKSILRIRMPTSPTMEYRKYKQPFLTKSARTIPHTLS